jgi:polysaccharide biosynthesis transport protein
MEQLDTRLRSTRQVEELLEVPSLGLVPNVAGLGVPLRQYLTDRPESAYAQAMRALYAQLQLTEVEGAFRVLLVTSALPGEGKTSLAASLAACAAELQGRTVLLDLDLRRPKVAREFGFEPRVGVVELLEGELGLEDAIWHDADGGVDVLPVAGNHPNPFSLLTSARLTNLLKQLDAHYDCVIIDSPPVLGVPDAKTLAGAADAIVFVLHWDRTTRAAAQAALKELRPFCTRVAGAVLSRVDLKRHARYSYGDAGQYYMQYSTYYRD